MLGSLPEKEAELNTQRAHITTPLGPGYPKVAELNRSLKQGADRNRGRTRGEQQIHNEYFATGAHDRIQSQKQEANQLTKAPSHTACLSATRG